MDFFVDITDQIIPAFEAAYGVEIKKDAKGWRERKLVAEEWSWLLHDLDDEKTAES